MLEWMPILDLLTSQLQLCRYLLVQRRTNLNGRQNRWHEHLQKRIHKGITIDRSALRAFM